MRRAWLLAWIVLAPAAQATPPVEIYDVAFTLHGEPKAGATVQLEAIGVYSGLGGMDAIVQVPAWIEIEDPTFWIDDDGRSTKTWNITIPEEGLWTITFRAADDATERQSLLPALVIDSRDGEGTSWTEVRWGSILPRFHARMHPWAEDILEVRVPATEPLRGLEARLFVGTYGDLSEEVPSAARYGWPFVAPDSWPAVPLGEAAAFTFDLSDRDLESPFDEGEHVMAMLYIPELPHVAACYQIVLNNGTVLEEGHCHGTPGQDSFITRGNRIITYDMKWSLGELPVESPGVSDESVPTPFWLPIALIGAALLRRP